MNPARISKDGKFKDKDMITRLTLLTALLLSPLVASADVRVETVMVSMRDGVQLATDIYRDDATRVAPVVLMRTPYNKDRAKGAAQRFAVAGYVAVVQDCRGKFASEGVFIPYNNDGQDGFDAIEWIGNQPWCNGRIGMWGSSYVGATQWQAAVEHPPKLVTITPTATWSSFYRNLYLGFFPIFGKIIEVFRFGPLFDLEKMTTVGIKKLQPKTLTPMMN